jgi:hypothetical protein
MNGTTAQTNSIKGSVISVPVQRKVRLLLWGGASRPSDNDTFDYAKRNVAKDYKALDKNKYIVIDKRIAVAQDIVDHINAQDNNSIRSLDIWTHGGSDALYLTTAEPPPPESEAWIRRRWYEVRRWGGHNSSLYRSRTGRHLKAVVWTSGSALLGDIEFGKFAENAKIEFHGCKTAADFKDEDNIAADFSERLFKAGKTQSVVIGHSENAVPLIDNMKPIPANIPKQDYRHGLRVIYHNGKLVSTTKQTRHLDEASLLSTR